MTDYKQHIKQFENHLGKKSKLNYRVQIIEIAHASAKTKKQTNNPPQTFEILQQKLLTTGVKLI